MGSEMCIRDSDDVDVEPGEDPRDRLGREVHVERRDEESVQQARQVGAGDVDAVLGEDRDTWRLVRVEQDARDAARVPGDLRVGPFGGDRLAPVGKQHAVGVCRHALLQPVEEMLWMLLGTTTITAAEAILVLTGPLADAERP